MGETKLKDRFQGLVEEYHGGSVNRAATETGLPQATLQRIAAGDVENPRAHVLERLAEYYHTSVDWLLFGNGLAPWDRPKGLAAYKPSPEEAEWRELVASLDLPDEAHVVMSALLPGMLGNLAYHFLSREGPNGLWAPPLMTPELLRARREERLALVRFFKEWIRISGREAVRQAAVDYPHLFATRAVLFEWLPPAMRADLATMMQSLTDAAPDDGAPAEATPRGRKKRS